MIVKWNDIPRHTAQSLNITRDELLIDFKRTIRHNTFMFFKKGDHSRKAVYYKT